MGSAITKTRAKFVLGHMVIAPAAAQSRCQAMEPTLEDTMNPTVMERAVELIHPQRTAPFGQPELREAFGHFPSGVTALCALGSGGDAQPIGLAASSFTSVSLEPALVSICIANASSTWPKLRGATRLGVSVLAAEQGGVSRQLAAKAADRFTGLDWSATREGAVFIGGSCLWLDCAVRQEVTAGDHEIVLLEIGAITSFAGREPLVFHGSQFRSLAML